MRCGSILKAMETRIIKDSITLAELRALAHEQYGDIIKAVADVVNRIVKP